MARIYELYVWEIFSESIERAIEAVGIKDEPSESNVW